MAHIRCDFRSEVMEMTTSMTVVLPEGVRIAERPVVYLFHGLEDNCSGWARYTGVERYARGCQAALVIPEVQRSFYTDMAFGLDYFRFIHEELPRICHNFFDISREPEKNYVMGLSMGGYAALKCMLKTPEWYAGCAAFSAVTDLRSRVEAADERRKREFAAIFGMELQLPKEEDLFELAYQSKAEALPRLYLACGEQDELFAQNEAFAGKLSERGVRLRFEHWEGIHNWDFWDVAAAKAFRALLAESESGGGQA